MVIQRPKLYFTALRALNSVPYEILSQYVHRESKKPSCSCIHTVCKNTIAKP